MKVELLEHKEMNKEMLPQIISRIFSICQTDNNFPIRKEMQDIGEIVSELEKKMEQKDSLLIQSSELKKNLNQRLNTLKENNFQTKSNLLETLGSEL